MDLKQQNPAVNGRSKGLHVHDAVELSSKNPLPFVLNGDSFQSVSGAEYYPIFSPDDNLFRDLLQVRLLSPTQAQCINDKTFYSTGAGLQVKDQKFPEQFDKKINGDGQTIDDILKGVFDSLYQDGNKFLEIVKITVGSKKYIQVYSHGNMDCRFEAKKDGSKPTHVLRTKQFRRNEILHWTKGSDFKPVRIPLWTDDPLNTANVWKSSNGGLVQRTMIHLKNEVQGIDHYGLPSNFAGYMQAVLEYKAARFNGDNFDNNMFVGGLLRIGGSMEQTEERKLAKEIKKVQIGEGKQQRIITVSGEQGVDDIDFKQFTHNNDGHFIEFDKHNENKIIAANGWSRALLDMNQTSGLGKGGEYLKNLFKMKYQTAIMPVQQHVLNNFIFPLMKIIDDFRGGDLYDLPWTITPVIPVTLEGILDMNSLLTVDEGRAAIDKGPLGTEQGKMLISSVKAPKQTTENKPDDGGE